MSSTELVIYTEDGVGHSIDYPIHKGQSIETYGHALEHFFEANKYSLVEKHLISAGVSFKEFAEDFQLICSDEEGEKVLPSDTRVVDPARPLKLVRVEYKVYIHDHVCEAEVDGFPYDMIALPLPNRQDTTIQEILDIFYQQTNKRLSHLTCVHPDRKNTSENSMEDNKSSTLPAAVEKFSEGKQTLRALGLHNETEFWGSISLAVIDDDLKETISLNVYLDQTLEEIRSLYELKAGRILHQPTFYQHVVPVEEEAQDDALQSDQEQKEKPAFDQTALKKSLYENGIESTTATISLKTGSFTIKIQEYDAKANPRQVSGAEEPRQIIELQVYDYETVDKIKVRYTEEANIALWPGDALVFGKDQLNPKVQLFKYRIKDGSLLYFQKEDESVPKFTYACADCGSDVILKPTDPVLCGQCGYRIVFKKRISTPCQYICR